MKYLSLFTGIGGFELGITQAYESKISLWDGQTGTSPPETIQQGLESAPESVLPIGNSTHNLGGGNSGSLSCIGFSEIDKYAIQIYQKQFPKHKNHGDVTKINVSELPDFDLLVGGFPCQAFSIAGKRKGFDDTRGTLFFDIARILKEKRPRNFILENVKGLLSHDNGRTFKTIISTLVELGYCVEWQVLNAKNFGVPQNRERVFIVGHFGGVPERKIFPITSSNGVFNREDQISATLDSNYHKGSNWNRTFINQLNEPKHSNDRIYGTDGISPTLNTAQGGNRQPFIAPVLTPDRLNKRQKGRRFKENGEVAFTQTAQDRHGIFNGSRIRRLTPLECERLMGYPDGWTEGLSDTQRYKTLGNGIVSNVVEEVVKRLWN